jgi:multidrug efflux pump subunit AcrB
MNIPRFFTENRQIGWVLLIATLVWGGVSYLKMPQRKDPEITIKTAVVTTAWPGAGAEDMEQLVTRPIERIAAQTIHVDKVTSTSRTGLSVVYVTLEDTARSDRVEAAWEDLRSRLETLTGLPPGTQKPLLNTHFGDTATVVFSVASPPEDALELDIRADAIRRAIDGHRARLVSSRDRASRIFLFPDGISRQAIGRAATRYLELGQQSGALTDGTVLRGGSFVALDFSAPDDRRLEALDEVFLRDVVGKELPHPDIREPVRVRDTRQIREALGRAAGDRYSYRELDEYTTLIQDELARIPEVGRVDRYGVVPEKIYLAYSQERLASFGLHPRQITEALKVRNIIVPGGTLSTGRQTVLLEPSGAYTDVSGILETVVANTSDGRQVCVRDVAELHRTYDTPIADSSRLTWRHDKSWLSTRSIAIGVQARSGVQVTALGQELDARIDRLRERLPPDLVIVKTSDQPALVHDKISEFMRSLAEAIAIVMAIALLLMERRSALVVVFGIPLTLAMTFGLMALFRIDLQQVSIASLIIALGLLVDDPVIASDAINREIAHGSSRRIAAWKGPTRLAKAILFATLTNIVAFAPLLLVTGTMGEFIYALPMVVTLSLVSSRIVSMTFVPLLGSYLLEGQHGYEAALEGSGRGARLARKYNDLTVWMLDHKRKSAVAFLLFLAVGLLPARFIRTHFFPEEALSRFYVHVRLPEGADVRATDAVVRQAREVMLETEGERLEHITAFIGNGGPRWWSNVSPEPRNPGYALMILELKDPMDSRTMPARLQQTLTGRVPGARFEVYRLSSGAPATIPVEVRISGPDIATLRQLSDQVKQVLLGVPATGDVTDDWGVETLKMRLEVDSARANRAGITHQDVATSSMLAFSGMTATQLRDGDRLSDVVVRLRSDERGSASNIRNLYVWSGRTGRAVPIEQVARTVPDYQPQKIVRYRQDRTITVGALPKPGQLPSSLLKDARKVLDTLPLPPGYRLEYGGEHEVQTRAFATVSIAMKVSVALIFIVLVWQFASVFKPIIVFGAIPFGLVGAVLGLAVSRTNFGFMAFLGVASLIGVIVSHIIVLFDFIEEAREEGVGLHRAVIDAGLVRLRPVLVTVLATVGGLIPLAIEGGPMWRQLVYVQIGGLLLATVVTKGVVPLMYVLFTEDLKLIDWKPSSRAA